MTKKQRFSALVSKEKTSTLDYIKARIQNRESLRESQQIALKILERLDELQWSQVDLAAKMNVTPQQINKIVKGKENLTLETQIKLQRILDIAILATYFEQKEEDVEMIVHFKNEQVYFDFERKFQFPEYLNSSTRFFGKLYGYFLRTNRSVKYFRVYCIFR